MKKQSMRSIVLAFLMFLMILMILVFLVFLMILVFLMTLVFHDSGVCVMTLIGVSYVPCVSHDSD